MSAATKLYTPELLGLAAGLAHYPLDEDAEWIGEARSRTCGSSIRLSARCEVSGAIERIGMAVTACAIGQSSAAILASGARGKTASDIAAMVAQIELWLAGDGAIPDWPGFASLQPARSHPGRHGALMLSWTALNQALPSPPSAS